MNLNRNCNPFPPRNRTNVETIMGGHYMYICFGWCRVFDYTSTCKNEKLNSKISMDCFYQTFKWKAICVMALGSKLLKSSHLVTINCLWWHLQTVKNNTGNVVQYHQSPYEMDRLQHSLYLLEPTVPHIKLDNCVVSVSITNNSILLSRDYHRNRAIPLEIHQQFNLVTGCL